MTLFIVNGAGLFLISLIIWWFWVAKNRPQEPSELEQGYDE